MIIIIISTIFIQDSLFSKDITAITKLNATGICFLCIFFMVKDYYGLVHSGEAKMAKCMKYDYKWG